MEIPIVLNADKALPSVKGFVASFMFDVQEKGSISTTINRHAYARGDDVSLFVIANARELCGNPDSINLNLDV